MATRRSFLTAAAAAPLASQVHYRPDMFGFEEVIDGLRMDLSETGLEEALKAIDGRHGRRRWDYTLVVPPAQMIYAKRLLRDIGMQVRDNPLAPYLNLLIKEAPGYKQANGKPNMDWWFVQALAQDAGSSLVVNVGSMGC